MASYTRYIESHREFIPAVLLVVLVAMAGVWGMQFSHAATNCAVTDTLVNPCHPWLGAAASGYGGVAPDNASQIRYDEQLIGRQVDLAHTYHNGSQNGLNSDDMYFINRPNTILDTDWVPGGTFASVANGSKDAAINNMANSIKSVAPKKIMLSIWHEPENDVSAGPWCSQAHSSHGSPADFVNMWHHIRQKFDADGVTNVVWVVNYMGAAKWDNCGTMMKDLWPGNNYVDWVMYDPYAHHGDTFNSIMSGFYNWMTQNNDATHDYLSKTWGINEWNGGDTYGLTRQEKIDLYNGAKAAIDNNTFPLLKAYVVFDSGDASVACYPSVTNKHTNPPIIDADVLAAYKAYANDPLMYNPTITDTTPPVATLSAPVTQTSVSGTVAVTGTATDDVGVAGVQLLVDSAVVSSATAPFDTVTLNWDSTAVVNGTHTLVLRATDAAGNSGQSSPVTVTVNNPDTTPPTVPSNLQTQVVDNATIQLSWSAATDFNGVTGYNVLRDGVRIGSVTDGSTTYTDTGLDAHTLYQYTVSAVDAAGNTSAESPAAAIMIQDDVAPSSPASLSAVINPNDAVALSWTAATDNVGVTGYTILRDGVPVGAVDGSTLTYIDTSAEQGQTYSYAVSAQDKAGNTSSASRVVAIAVPDITPPSQPVYITVLMSGAAVNVSWQDSQDNVAVVGYRLYRNSVLISTSATTAYMDSSVTQGATYSYTLQAYDAAGNVSAMSSAKSITIPDTTAPTSPGTPTVKLNSAKTGVVVSWSGSTDNVGVSAYQVWRNGANLKTVTNLTFTDTGVKQGSIASYVVYAVDAAGNRSNPSATSAAIKVPDTTAPSVPSGVTAASVIAKTVKISWKASSDNVGVVNYYIYKGITKIATVSGSTLSYTATGLVSGTSYKFSVQAVDAAGNSSAQSTQVTIKSK